MTVGNGQRSGAVEDVRLAAENAVSAGASRPQPARGIVWHDIVAEIERDQAGRTLRDTV